MTLFFTFARIFFYTQKKNRIFSYVYPFIELYVLPSHLSKDFLPNVPIQRCKYDYIHYIILYNIVRNFFFDLVGQVWRGFLPLRPSINLLYVNIIIASVQFLAISLFLFFCQVNDKNNHKVTHTFSSFKRNNHQVHICMLI